MPHEEPFDAQVAGLIHYMACQFQQRKREKQISPRITRGRAVNLAAEFESQIAELIEQNTEPAVFIWLDMPLTYSIPGKPRKTIFYPDVVVLQDSSMRAIVECKIDLRYSHQDWIEKHNARLDALRTLPEVWRHNERVPIGTSLVSAIVVLSAANHTKRLDPFRQQVENAIVLAGESREHPNDDMPPDDFMKLVGTPRDKVNWARLRSFVRKAATP